MENNIEKREFETIIIGAGQAGLAVGRYLKEQKRNFIILDENDEIGTSWKGRYDSLVLDSYAKYTALEDFPFPGDPLHHPTRAEVVNYLQSFAAHFKLEPLFSTKVLRVSKGGEMFIVVTTSGNFYAKFVILATGPFYVPVIPEYARNISPYIHQLHSGQYKNSAELTPGKTLVVGGGNSGAEIAEEIADAGGEVLFAYKGKFRSVKSYPWSQWLAYALGLAHVPKHTLLGKLIIWYTKGKAVGVDIKKILNHPRITQVGEIIGTEEGSVVSEAGVLSDLRNIVWATGYKSDFSIITIPGFDPEAQKRGLTNIPGLFILNMRWQYSKSSSHLAGISRDAKYIAEYIKKINK